VVNLVVLACLLRTTTKKGRQLFEEKKCTFRENPGYAYDVGALLRTTLGAYSAPPSLICLYFCVNPSVFLSVLPPGQNISTPMMYFSVLPLTVVLFCESDEV